MGNAAAAYPSPATAVKKRRLVRLLRADGKVSEFSNAVTASRIMDDYPGHVVVHHNPGQSVVAKEESSPPFPARCDHTSSTDCVQDMLYPVFRNLVQHVKEAACAGNCWSIDVSQPQPIERILELEGDEEVQPGNTYYLHPKSSQLSSQLQDYTRKTLAIDNGIRQPPEVENSRQQSLLHVRASEIFNSNMKNVNRSSPPENMFQIHMQGICMETFKQYKPDRPRSARRPMAWKPALESIPESDPLLEFRRPIFVSYHYDWTNTRPIMSAL
ncbi:hypothetical protein R1flu_004619 [Riccia fluitans]|uniref:Uncharacterized protein n=1 Tax=Riccia fluitans TaxID=41844 RepID=A0ABD1YQU6_9MARC